MRARSGIAANVSSVRALPSNNSCSVVDAACADSLVPQQLAETLTMRSCNDSASQRTSFAPLHVDDVTMRPYVREPVLFRDGSGFGLMLAGG